jgi:hypothetical protein
VLAAFLIDSVDARSSVIAAFALWPASAQKIEAEMIDELDFIVEIRERD